MLQLPGGEDNEQEMVERVDSNGLSGSTDAVGDNQLKGDAVSNATSAV